MYSRAEEEVRRRIGQQGRITFAEFMELALYGPCGYYSGASPVGDRGDFYTAPAAHPAFAALLSVQLLQMWRHLGQARPFWVVELGAGDGLLCRDLVHYAALLPQEFFRSLRYLCVDRRSTPGAEGHGSNPEGPLVDRLVAKGSPLRSVVGCFISNELVDSFPVNRVAMRGGRLHEVYVTLEGGQLKETLDAPSTPALEGRLESLGVQLPEGYQAEVNLAMEAWAREVAQALQQGYVITIDYGHEAAELYSPRRSSGTLTCFYKHTQTNNPYIRIGSQDMTSQVDFTALTNLGRAAGLRRLGYLTQREFLTNLGLRQLLAQLPTLGLPQPQGDANRMAMLDLIRYGGMGDFKVLVQSKGGAERPLWGLAMGPERYELLAALPVPLLTPQHTPLLQGRYPHLACDWEPPWPKSDP